MKKGNKRLIISLVIVALLYAGGCLIEQTAGTKSMVVTVLQKGAVYALIAVSMNLLNGFTGLFSLGQAGFMLVGALPHRDTQASFHPPPSCSAGTDAGLFSIALQNSPYLL